MVEEIKINKQLFHERLAHLVSTWKADRRGGDALFGGTGSILVMLGKADAKSSFSKSSAMNFWLLGYEFPATLFLFTTEKLHVVTTTKKASYLQPLKGGKFPIELLVRGKDAEQNTKLFQDVLDAIKAAGRKVGVLPKDIAAGPFAEEWKKLYETASKEIEEVDFAQALSATALSVKDENELRAMRNASKACAGIMSPFFVGQMSAVLDEEEKIKHSALATKIDGIIDNTAFFKKNPKLPGDFDASQLDWTYGPVVQSGGKYDLRLGAQPDDENLHAGVIVAAFGLRYRMYCSMVARTYLVDPNKSQEANYKLLLTIHETVIKEIREGALLKDIYSKAVRLLKTKRPELEKHFVRSLGSGIGLEMRDATLVINGKNSRTLKDGMTLGVTTGFNDLQNPTPQDKQSAVYSLVLSDTVRVTRSEPVVFTADAPSDSGSTAFFFKDEEEQSPKVSEKKDPRVGAIALRNITKTKLRAERKQIDPVIQAKRREGQRAVAKKNQNEGLQRFAGQQGGQNGVAPKVFKQFDSYKRNNQFPDKVKDLAIFIDHKNLTLVLPIMGRPVPFHINTIKNASKSDEGEWSYLRINFLSPGQGVGRKEDQPFEDPSAHFVRSFTFRSKDADRMGDIATQITDLRKTSLRREQEKKDMEGVVEQDKLVEIRNRRPQRLTDVLIRPALDGKRLPGEVEIHQNGIRYHSALRPDLRVDILFSNIEFFFFQPSLNELIVIIHAHLKNPIVVGKRRTHDVQFYREATEIQFDETGNRKRKHRFDDDEEYAAEEEERRRRAALDKDFRNFAEKVAEAGRNDGVSVDIPYRGLGFYGVPNRAHVLIQPTTDCLVSLTDPPFFVLPLRDIEAAHIERLQFGLKNFDLVLVLKDFTKPPVHINTIPVTHLDSVKDWFMELGVAQSEGPLNLNWSTIMKTVAADPYQFYLDGGWSTLGVDSDDDDSIEEDDEDSAFELSDADMARSAASSEDDSGFDEDASDFDDGDASDDGDDDDDGESDSVADDWDELEKKAARKDRESAPDDRDTARKRKR